MTFDVDIFAVDEVDEVQAKFEPIRKTTKKSKPHKSVVKKDTSPPVIRIEPVKNEEFKYDRTYLLLPDGTYFELLTEEAERLTDDMLREYIKRRFGNPVARDMKIFRPE